MTSPELLSRVHVVYVLGAGRSGSTVLGDALALAKQARHVGELRGLFDYLTDASGLMRCSCGEVYQSCDYWAPLLAEHFGNQWPERFKRRSFYPLLPRSWFVALKSLLGGEDRVFEQLSDQVKTGLRDIGGLIRSNEFAERTGRVLIDSSKSPVFAWLLSRERLPIVCVHLIRDPRAVIYSWSTRPIPLPDADGASMRLATRGQLEALMYWLRANVGSFLTRLYGLPYLRIRYEEFVDQPVASLKRIEAFARAYGVPLQYEDKSLAAIAQGLVSISDRHLIGANPGVKAQQSVMKLHKDLAWRNGMGTGQRVLWTLLLLPILLWLGYPLQAKGTSTR